MMRCKEASTVEEASLWEVEPTGAKPPCIKPPCVKLPSVWEPPSISLEPAGSLEQTVLDYIPDRQSAHLSP